MGSSTRLPLLKLKTSIGSGTSADFHLDEEGLDEIQCWIEHDGSTWRFRQESKLRPTYVNGQAEAYCALAHGSKLSFGGKGRIRLICVAVLEQSRRRKRLLMITLIGLALLAGITATVLKYFGF